LGGFEAIFGVFEVFLGVLRWVLGFFEGFLIRNGRKLIGNERKMASKTPNFSHFIYINPQKYQNLHFS
jgi:hypothetical protein